MGSICGIKVLDKNIPLTIAPLKRMNETLTHRGSNSTVLECSGDTIIGAGYHGFETKTASTAMDNENGIWVALDGHIFKHQLKDYEGCDDAEALLRLYKKYGEALATMIDGSYALVIYDAGLDKLILLRDRLGYKPLFYSNAKKAFVFASEVKALLASGAVGRSIDPKALNDFLAFGYLPNPETLLKSIRQVRPGHFVVFQNEILTESEYWSLAFTVDEKQKSEDEYKEEFLSILETAISRRLMKYPNAGAFLSGGLDTGALVAVMRKLKTGPLSVFTAGFAEEEYNEIDEAKLVADHLDLEHHTVIVGHYDFPSLIEKLVWFHDQPFHDTSAIPSFYAAQLAKQYTDVVLTGDLPDQLLAGSGHHVKTLAYHARASLLKTLLNRPFLNRIMTCLPMAAAGTTLFDKIKRRLYLDTFPPEERCFLLRTVLPDLLRRKLYAPELLSIDTENKPLDIARSLYKGAKGAPLLDRLLYYDIKSYAPDDLMVKVERMTMSLGLLAFSPFHDQEMVDFTTRLPTSLKIKDGSRKYIMREAVRPLLPSAILTKKKQGFAAPIDEWLLGELSGYVKEVLLDGRTLQRGYFDKKPFVKMVTDYFQGKTDYATGSSYAIIALLTLELWHRLFIDIAANDLE
ncbi:MAG: asparagine synthase (glutamine-hydrolyzing) [Syntrophaceae bacterium]|nr:asparagine synthase (glutamine-hydrolyzing) [Syntrophaceae bacterium]